MPSLHSAGIRVRLGTIPLEQTLTPNIVLKKGEIAAQQCEDADAQLRKSEFLDEEHVVFPGDEEGFAMNWLAEAPFLQVVTEDAFKNVENQGVSMGSRRPMESAWAHGVLAVPSERSLGRSTRNGRRVSVSSTRSRENTPSSSNRRHPSRHTPWAAPHTPSTINPAHLHLTPTSSHAVPDTDLVPKALVLHVMLTSKTFYQSIIDGTLQHIKIDVFFNGQLSSCILIHQNDLRAGVKSMHQIFAGTRVDYMIERPWVIVPPGKKSDGTADGGKKKIGVQKRWAEVCHALMQEANARGVKASGERPPSAEYLKELASMQMPDAVEGMQKPGGKTFGVVDVVVTVGIGKKITNGVGYLKKPMRLVDGQYSHKLDEEEAEESDGKKKESYGKEQGREDRYGAGSEEGVVQIDRQDELSPDPDAEGEPDPDYPAPVMSAPLPPAHSFSDPRPPPAFQNPFTGTPIPNLSPSGASVYPSIGTVQSRKRSHSQLTALPNKINALPESHMQPRDARQSFPSAHAPSSTPRNLKQPTIPSPEYNINQYEGFMHANPYQLPFADMMVGLDVAVMPGLTPINESSSSPLRDQAPSQLTLLSFNQPDLNQMRGVEGCGTPSVSSPFMPSHVLPSQSRRVSFGQTSVAPYNPGAAPTLGPAGPGISSQGRYSFPAHTYGSSPLAERSFGSQIPQPYFHASPFIQQPIHRPMGPHPPIGLFKATTKPKTPMRIDPSLIDTEQPPPSILVRRLCITGIDGASILDHQWKTPQRIVAARSSETRDQALVASDSLSKSRRESPGSSEYMESSAALPLKPGAATMNAMSAPTSPAKTSVSSSAVMGVKKTKRDSVHDTRLVPMSNDFNSNLPLPAPKPAVKDTTPAQSSTASSRASTRGNSTMGLVKAVTTRRTISNGILGVQGPKANIFVFDDPEELLRRKGPKSRTHTRSLSPTKVDAPQSDSVAVRVKEIEVTAVTEVNQTEALEMVSSSPLSSVPASPETHPTVIKGNMQVVAELALQAETAATSAPSSSLPTATLPPPSSSLSHPPTEPTSRPQPTQTPPPVNSDTRAMPPPATPSSLKKNASNTLTYQTGPRVRLPRSPARISTIRNPPLNRDCVIQFAQSKVDQGIAGPLRQVKCERQGVFREESVVVGIRFFVPG
ncbi:hypothetical protein K458DRAFT_492064 [Lentithecium fluviatile CBS 122367]|uniref:Uncharacterized protein n=1 Tax=Lentithecium fluviatile CBS 122367 TaxID=1168545 RepID=A0A6G1IFM7_9PLEO|nr:hypothetical protein K458DRAFT_492064 [Lentithecium fluviatile CBS 122367]